MKRKTRRKNVTLLIAIALLLMSTFSLAACSSEKKGTEQEEEIKDTADAFKENTAQEDAAKEETAEEQLETETNEEAASAEPSEKNSAETVTETEMITYETALDWAKTVNEEGPRLSIWNELSKQAMLLESGQNYMVKEGDILVLCCRFASSVGLDIDTPILNEISGSSVHTEYEFTEIPTAKTDINFLVGVNGQEYELTLTVGDENSEGTIDDDSEPAEMSGKDWALALEFDEPELVVWNEETGTKERIANGGQYEMQEGDMIAIGCWKDDFIIDIQPLDFAGEMVTWPTLTVIDYRLPTESTEINLKGEVYDGGDGYSFNFIITTP